LAFAVRAAAERWQVIYLGPNTPLAQALDTAVRTEAAILALSLTVARPAAEVGAMLDAIASARAARPALRVLAGGRAALAQADRLAAAGVEVATDITGPPLVEKMRAG
jgi:methylmalonyl-CoA mutase cobalamin-binding subunit